MNVAHLPFAYRLAALTPRELRLACLYADGVGHWEATAYVGEVNGTRARILRKLGLQKAGQLVYYRAELKAKAGIIL